MHTKYISENRGKMAAHENKRRASKLMATPSWSEADQIRLIYARSAQLGLEVDHVVPLYNDLVSGLHVHANLQLLAASCNRSKGNRHWPDMP